MPIQKINICTNDIDEKRRDNEPKEKNEDASREPIKAKIQVNFAPVIV